LVPGWLSWQAKTRRTIAPTRGIRPISSHHPDLPMSWRRRTPTARLGISRPSARITPRTVTPRIPSMIEATTEAMK
jgi:hypothetical protein